MEIDDRQPRWRKGLYSVIAAVLGVVGGLITLLTHHSTLSRLVAIAWFVAAACEVVVARYYLKKNAVTSISDPANPGAVNDTASRIQRSSQRQPCTPSDTTGSDLPD